MGDSAKWMKESYSEGSKIIFRSDATHNQIYKLACDMRNSPLNEDENQIIFLGIAKTCFTLHFQDAIIDPIVVKKHARIIKDIVSEREGPFDVI